MEETSSELEHRFHLAAEFAKTKIGSLGTDKILKLYGLYKQATEGENKSQKPNFWNATAKKKWEAWSANGKKSTDEAMEEYIALVSLLDPNWAEQPASSFSWVHHSTMANNDEIVPDAQKDLFYWVKENNLEALKNMLASVGDVAVKDEDGLSLLHWAADRGYTDVIHYLVHDAKADPNVKDSDGQTPLHYAASCGHVDAVAMLLTVSDASIEDFDGLKPCDVASSLEIKELFKV